MGEKRNIC